MHKCSIILEEECIAYSIEPQRTIFTVILQNILPPNEFFLCWGKSKKEKIFREKAIWILSYRINVLDLLY